MIWMMLTSYVLPTMLVFYLTPKLYHAGTVLLETGRIVAAFVCPEDRRTILSSSNTALLPSSGGMLALTHHADKDGGGGEIVVGMRLFGSAQSMHIRYAVDAHNGDVRMSLKCGEAVPTTHALPPSSFAEEDEEFPGPP